MPSSASRADPQGGVQSVSRLIPMHHHDSAVERARHRDGDEPPQEGRGGGGRVERQVKDEARNALLVGSIDAREDGFLQLASELVWHASGMKTCSILSSRIFSFS